MGLTFSGQLKKLTLLTIYSQEIGNLSATSIIMKHNKGKEKMIYALKMYCGVMHGHEHKVGFLGRRFPSCCVNAETKIQINTTLSQKCTF